MTYCQGINKGKQPSVFFLEADNHKLPSHNDMDDPNLVRSILDVNTHIISELKREDPSTEGSFPWCISCDDRTSSPAKFRLFSRREGVIGRSSYGIYGDRLVCHSEERLAEAVLLFQNYAATFPQLVVSGPRSLVVDLSSVVRSLLSVGAALYTLPAAPCALPRCP